MEQGRAEPINRLAGRWVAAKYPSVDARKPHPGKGPVRFGNAVENFAAVLAQCTTNRADIPLETLMAAHLDPKRAAELEVWREQPRDRLEIPGVPDALIKASNQG